MNHVRIVQSFGWMMCQKKKLAVRETRNESDFYV